MIRPRETRAIFTSAFCLACVLCVATFASAQTFTSLHSFDGTDGTNPANLTLTQAQDGNLYGTAFTGGSGNPGTAYMLTPSGVFNLLSTFNCTQGCTPAAGYALGPNGLLYGTTYAGGSASDGSIYTMNTSGVMSPLFTFTGTNGVQPYASLVLGSDGVYYGTTYKGGTNSSGTAFSITSTGTFTTLYNFCSLSSCTDGKGPIAGLVEGQGHVFYGVTEYGGSANKGVIFSISRTGVYTTLYNFDSAETDGGLSYGTLALGTDGNFYGTSTVGGTSLKGAVWQVTPAGVVTLLHSFSKTDGSDPEAGVIQATDGNFYGTTAYGGTKGDGTIFEVSSTGTFTTLYNFTGPDGIKPYGGLMQHTNGKIYGSTFLGGASGDGTLFSIDVGLGPFVRLVLSSGKVGTTVEILGQNLTGTTSVTFNGTPAKSYSVISDTFMKATVPTGATSGPVVVATPSGNLTSNVFFQIHP